MGETASTGGEEDKALALRGRAGLSPRYWSEAIQLQGSRIDDDHRAIVEAPRESPEREQTMRRLHIDVHYLLISTGHLLRCLRTCAEVLDDKDVREIRDDFDQRAPYIKHVRDVLEHLDEYASGSGRLVKRGELRQGSSPILMFELGDHTEPFVLLGTWKLPVRRLAMMGTELGQRLAEAWEERFGPDDDLTLWGRSS